MLLAAFADALQLPIFNLLMNAYCVCAWMRRFLCLSMSFCVPTNVGDFRGLQVFTQTPHIRVPVQCADGRGGGVAELQVQHQHRAGRFGLQGRQEHKVGPDSYAHLSPTRACPDSPLIIPSSRKSPLLWGVVVVEQVGDYMISYQCRRLSCVDD